MGVHSSAETLAIRWAELCADPLLRDLPGKVELNAFGVIELSPATNRHALMQSRLYDALTAQMPAGGRPLFECSVATTEGVRVPDVAWGSAAYMAREGESTPFSRAPELCIEVRSPSNTDAEMAFKTRLYLEAGAEEVWIVDADGRVHVFDTEGERAASRWGVTPVLPPA